MHIFFVIKQIMKRDADLFGSDELPIPPTCEVTIWSKGSEEYLSYTVPLIGIHSDDVHQICIQRYLQTSYTSGRLYHTVTVMIINIVCGCVLCMRKNTCVTY